MTNEQISKLAQACFQARPTIILGSGATMPHGLPSMATLSTYLPDNLQTIANYWQYIAQTTSITKKFKAKAHVSKLMATPMTDNADLSAQITKLTAEIVTREHELNEVIYELYALTPEERQIIERG